MAEAGESVLAPALGAAAAGTGALAIAGLAQRGSAWAPFNALAGSVLGPDVRDRVDFAAEVTPVGLGINIVGLAGWGLMYRVLFGRVPMPASLATGALAGAALYGLDYHLAPGPLRPGFERHLSWPAIACKYAAIGLALAILGPATPACPPPSRR